MQNAPEVTAPIGLGAVFTLLFVTLGPLKIVGPFVQLTREADDATMKKIAVRAFVLALIAVVVGGFVGQALLENWGISIPALLLAGAIIFLLVGLSLVLEQVLGAVLGVLQVALAVEMLLRALYQLGVLNG
jgi:multiple antibiotic resistance protein